MKRAGKISEDAETFQSLVCSHINVYSTPQLQFEIDLASNVICLPLRMLYRI